VLAKTAAQRQKIPTLGNGGQGRAAREIKYKTAIGFTFSLRFALEDFGGAGGLVESGGRAAALYMGLGGVGS
jgi:hypothetical protein